MKSQFDIDLNRLIELLTIFKERSSDENSVIAHNELVESAELLSKIGSTFVGALKSRPEVEEKSAHSHLKLLDKDQA